jgi:aryl-phospho-beta-D-glucosidase BglC (GH1 family)
MRSILFYLFLLFSSVTNAIPPPLSIQGNQIMSGSQPYIMRGVNWFGFNNGQTMVDGLWSGGTSFATDFNTIVYKLKLLGFNSVRLPFTHADIRMKSKPQIQNCNILSVDKTIQKTIDPRITLKPDNKKVPIFVGKFPRSICNEYLINGTTFERLVQTMETFLNNDMYVILDYHPMNTEFQARDINAFSRSWRSLWYNLLRQRPNWKGRVILDIMNEPDSMYIGWTRSKTKQGPSISELTFAMIESIQEFDQTTLFMIEGTAQANYNLNWGDGYVTDREIIKKHDIDDPNNFFQQLVTKPYKTKIIIGPHIYGPTVSKNKIAHKGKLLRERIYKSFGYLFHQGYCFNGKCTKFPIVIGEFGSTFLDPEDIAHLNDLADIINNNFSNRASWIFWAYNANSGDTGGLVTDDWQDLNWTKLRWLSQKLGLKMWWN